MNDLLLDIRNLKVHFFTDEGVVQAVDGADLPIVRGKTLALVGESGCGKSVACRSLLQIVHPPGRIVEGEILLRRNSPDAGAIDIAQLHPRGKPIRTIRGRDIAMIFQEPMTSLSPMYTVGNQIIEAIRLHNRVSPQEARKRSVHLLDQVGIPKPDRLVDEYPFRLSGGMRQRAMIAMALSCRPALLIADEPTTALDVTTQANILDLMLDLQKEYCMTLLFITHDLGVVAEIADEVAVMYLGRIVERSDVDTIFYAPKHPYTQALLASVPKIGARRDRLDPIRGMVPSPFRRPAGCPFHPRCPQAMDRCRATVPASTVLREGHVVECLLYESAPTGDTREPTE